MRKKSYAGFILWLLGFVAAMFAVSFLPTEDWHMPVRLLTAWFMAGLAFHIWRREQVYWYNGTSFEEAEAAGKERRKAFAWQHVRIFGGLALAVTVVSCGTWLLGWSAWIDFTVCMVRLIIACCCTVPIKL